MEHVIETKNLSRRFGKKHAVRGLDLAVPAGSIFAFLGPNGAGKTTTIKMLMNILPSTEGRASVLGADSSRLGPREFSQIGYVSENQKMPEWMTVGQLIEFCKPMYPAWDDAFCERLLQQFALRREDKIKSLSRGNKTKASLLSSLSYHPRLLVLDEPFSGLDPLVRDEFIRGVLELTEQQQWTIFISSHDIDEVERLADWVGIINQGELQLAESMAALQARFRQIEVVTRDTAQKPSSPPSSWLNLEVEGHTIRFVECQFSEQGWEAAGHLHFSNAVQKTVQPMSLREIFLSLARHYRFNT